MLCRPVLHILPQSECSVCAPGALAPARPPALPSVPDALSPPCHVLQAPLRSGARRRCTGGRACSRSRRRQRRTQRRPRRAPAAPSPVSSVCRMCPPPRQPPWAAATRSAATAGASTCGGCPGGLSLAVRTGRATARHGTARRRLAESTAVHALALQSTSSSAAGLRMLATGMGRRQHGTSSTACPASPSDFLARAAQPRCWTPSPPRPRSINISEGMSRRLRCMAPGCGVVCDEDKVRQLLARPCRLHR